MTEARDQAELGDRLRDLRTVPGISITALEGQNIPMGPRAALTLSLIVHELTTDARKIGALSVPEGFVTVDWSASRMEGGLPILMIDWKQTNGPPVCVASKGIVVARPQSRRSAAVNLFRQLDNSSILCRPCEDVVAQPIEGQADKA